MKKRRVIVRWVMRGWQDFTLDEVRARFPDSPNTNDDHVWHAWLYRRDAADLRRLLSMVELDGIASDSTTSMELEDIDIS